MPTYYDENMKSWFCKFYYTDYTGQRKQKKKRGFKYQREAKAWERTFLEKQQADLNMPFYAFIDIYMEDMGHRLRESTVLNKKYMIELKLIPYFGNLSMSQIKATDIRKWQNEMISYRDANNKSYSETYLKSINNQLTAIFNYAMKYYDLKENPCRKAGSMGKKHADEMSFWTFQEFSKFIDSIDNQQAYTSFMTLYYTGMRIGELMALTLNDLDFKHGTITINKSIQRINGEDIITPPKTPKSKRVITIPQRLIECLKAYINNVYEISVTDRIFPYTKHFLHRAMIKGCQLSEVKRIRLHDIRHSHASLLIELGFSPLLIADRLGHEKIETTLNTYSHLYPHKQDEVVMKLQNLS